MTDLHAIKKEARKAARARRKAAKAADSGAAAARAMAVFLERVALGPEDVVSAYRPIQSELDPTPLMEALHARGVTLCVPVILEEGAPLSFRRWSPGCAMETGAFGAEIPVGGAEVAPTLLVAPLLSFDRRGARLGYGGGFYDRTLERLRARRPTRAYGYAYAAQEVEAVPVEATDQRLDGIVTEAGFIAPG